MEINKVRNTVFEINRIVRSNLWFDFELLSYSREELKIVGGVDLTYGYTLSINFLNVFLLSSPVDWKTDTNSDFLFLLEGEETFEIYKQLRIEVGYFLFKIITEDGFNIYISSSSLGFENGEKGSGSNWRHEV